MNPTWRARQAVSFARLSRLISSPATVMLPELGTSSPPIRLRSVVLPEPLGPMKATKSPLSTLRLTPWRTCSSSLPAPVRLGDVLHDDEVVGPVRSQMNHARRFYTATPPGRSAIVSVVAS